MEVLDVRALLEARLAANMARAPTDADALVYRRIIEGLDALMNLISDVAHQGPIPYYGNTRKHIKSDPAESRSD